MCMCFRNTKILSFTQCSPHCIPQCSHKIIQIQHTQTNTTNKQKTIRSRSVHANQNTRTFLSQQRKRYQNNNKHCIGAQQQKAEQKRTKNDNKPQHNKFFIGFSTNSHSLSLFVYSPFNISLLMVLWVMYLPASHISINSKTFSLSLCLGFYSMSLLEQRIYKQHDTGHSLILQMFTYRQRTKRN